MKKLLTIILVSLLILTACGKTTIKKAKEEYYRYNHKKAKEMFKKLAKQGNLEAKYYLGMLYKESNYIKENKPKKAEKLFKEVLNNYDKNTNNPFILEGVGYLLRKGIATEENYKKSEKHYEKAYKILNNSKEKLKNNSNYEYLLAYIYDTGRGPKEGTNLIKALKWYKKTSKNGNMYANNNIGHIYLYGGMISSKILKDYNKSIKYFKKNAKKGEYHSQKSLYVCYIKKSKASNKAKNLKKAKKWIKKVRENKYTPKELQREAKRTWDYYKLWNY